MSIVKNPGTPTAILVIDMAGDMFSHQMLSGQRAGLVSAINALTQAARGSGYPVVWVRQEYKDDLSDAPLEYKRREIHSTIEGTPGAELLPELDVTPQDHHVIKKRYSGFFETDLEDYLRRQGIGRLVIAGVNTHACVRTTAIDAYQRDYDVMIVRECVGSYDQRHHDISLRYMEDKIAKVITLDEFLTTHIEA